MTISAELELESIMMVSPRRKLENNLRKLLEDERFFDITLKCSDSLTLRACKNILAVRSEVFNDLIFDNVDKPKKQLEFNKIDSVAMKYILEYLYTSENERETLRKNNVIEIYFSSIYFKLNELQKTIIEFTEKILRNGDEELGKDLLTSYIEKFSLEADNDMANLLVNWVAKIQLLPHEADKDLLSLTALHYLLKKTYCTDKSFGTYELTLFEYTLVKAKYTVLEEKIGSKKDTYDMKYDSNIIERIQERLTPLLPYIDLRMIDPDEIVNKLEPLKIFPSEMITNVYRFRIEKKHEKLQLMRGRLIFKWKNFGKDLWQAENRLYISNNGFTVGADPKLKNYKSIMGDLTIKGRGIHRWDILVVNLNDTIYIGICGFEEEFNKPGDKGFHGWALGSDGYIYNKRDWKWNSSVYKIGDVINIIVDMDSNHCYFGVNNNIRYENFGHSFPDEIYPFVSLKRGSKLRLISY